MRFINQPDHVLGVEHQILTSLTLVSYHLFIISEFPFTPELDQPGYFPTLINGLPLPEIRCIRTLECPSLTFALDAQQSPLLPTKPRSPIFVNEEISTFYDLLKYTKNDRNLSSTQLGAAKKLSRAMETVDFD